MVPEPCFHCFTDLAVGDLIVTRRLVNDTLSIEPGERGSIVAIRANVEFGKLYMVKLESGITLTCPRAAIRRQ